MHGLKTPAFLGLCTPRPASPALNTSPSAITPVVVPIAGSAPITPLELSAPASIVNEGKDGSPRRPLTKLHLPSAFRRASLSPSTLIGIPTSIDKPSVGSNYFDALALRISEAVSKAVASPTPAHNSDGLLLNGRRPLPAGRGKALGQLITTEINAAAPGGNDLLRASLRALHRPLNVLLSNVSGTLATLVVTNPTNVLAPASGWVANGVAQAHALGYAIMVGELLEALDGLPSDCTKVGGEGLRNIKEGLEEVIKRVVNPLLAAVRTELGTLIDALEAAPEPCVASRRDKGVAGDNSALGALHGVIPCATRVLGRIASIPGPVVRGALATCQIAIVWRAMVSLAHRKVGEPAPPINGGSPTKTSSGSILAKSQSVGKSLGKPQSSGSVGPSAAPASLTRRPTPPNTPPVGRFGSLLPPSRPASPPEVLTPSARLAHDARVVVGLLDSLPKPAGDDAREAVVEAFDALRAFTDLLRLLSGNPIDRQAVINLVDGESGDGTERDELPALVVFPALLRGKSVASLLDIGEAEYRERCLAGFGRAEANEQVVVKAMLATGLDGWGADREWIKGWLRGRT